MKSRMTVPDLLRCRYCPSWGLKFCHTYLLVSLLILPKKHSAQRERKARILLGKSHGIYTQRPLRKARQFMTAMWRHQELNQKQGCFLKKKGHPPLPPFPPPGIANTSSVFIRVSFHHLGSSKMLSARLVSASLLLSFP